MIEINLLTTIIFFIFILVIGYKIGKKIYKKICKHDYILEDKFTRFIKVSRGNGKYYFKVVTDKSYVCNKCGKTKLIKYK